MKSKVGILKKKEKESNNNIRKEAILRTYLAETIITSRVNKMASFISKTYSVYISLKRKMKTKS
jgi:hypothetical protein